jgi:hypothetical protein
MYLAPVVVSQNFHHGYKVEFETGKRLRTLVDENSDDLSQAQARKLVHTLESHGHKAVWLVEGE